MYSEKNQKKSQKTIHERHSVPTFVTLMQTNHAADLTIPLTEENTAVGLVDESQDTGLSTGD